jgi:hypothetical protein
MRAGKTARAVSGCRTKRVGESRFRRGPGRTSGQPNVKVSREHPPCEEDGLTAVPTGLSQVDTDREGEVRRSDAGPRRGDLDRLEVHTELTETLRNARLSCLLSSGGHGDRGEDHRIDGEVDDQPDPDQQRSVDPDRFDEDDLEQDSQGQGSAQATARVARLVLAGPAPGLSTRLEAPTPGSPRFPAAASGLSGVPSHWRASTSPAPSAPPVGPRPRGDGHGREPDRVGDHQALA